MIIPKEIFFSKLNLPSFLLDEFQKENWYELPLSLKVLLKEKIKHEINTTLSSLVILKNQVYIGQNTIVGEFTVIEGPVYIGNNVEIGSSVHIRAGSVISDNCVIGSGAQVKNSLMMENSKISNHCFLGDSIIGVNARLGGHSETMNRRFDQEKILLKYEEESVEINADKYGLILGEGSRLGGGVLTSPGTLIGKNTFVDSGLVVGGFIPGNKFVKNKTEQILKDNNFNKGLHSNSRLYE